MMPGLALLAVCASVGGELIAPGGNPSRGVLVNVTVGAAPFQPPDPARPTIVFVHGFNPTPRIVHFTMSRRLSEAIGRRFGARFNVLSWDWNAATYAGLGGHRNEEHTVAQGHALAAALRRAGVSPGRTHLVGHSSGCIVAASAARCLVDQGLGLLAHLTLLEAAEFYHDAVFGRLAPWTAATVVDNYWAEGPSGFGRHAPYPGVRNFQVPTRWPLLGALSPAHSAHLQVLRWYFLTVEDPHCPAGFNTSVLLHGAS